jgi:hypothetical protein
MDHSGKRIPHFLDNHRAINGGPPTESRPSRREGRLRSQGSAVSHLFLAALLLVTFGLMLWVLVQLARA